MASPPFPVPRGMEWDPGKKRFFKAPPAKAKVAPKQVSPSPPLEKCLARQQPIRPCRLAQTRISPSSFALACRATRPTLGASQRFRRGASQCALGGARHVATTTLIPWAQRGWRVSAPDLSTSWSVGIRTLFCPRELGSLLYFSNGTGSLFLLDTAHITRREYSCALAHFFDYIPLALPHQTQPIFDVDWSTIMCVSDLQMPTQNSVSPCLSSVTSNRVATIVGDELVVYSTGAKTGRNHHAVVLSKLKVAKDPIRILCVRECKGGRSTVLAYATQRQFGVCRFGSAGKTDTIAFQRMESDIICLDIFPSASTVLVGLRNGRIVQHSTKHFLKRSAQEVWRRDAPQERSAPALTAGEGVAFASLGPGLIFPVPGRGAVTNLLAVSNGEVLVAYSSGQLFLVSADRPEDPLTQFEGHVNSWSLDLPLAFDALHRLVAAAGQDRRVRVWSMDHPLPLRTNEKASHEQADVFDLIQSDFCPSSLQDTIFAAPISGLAFCQRRSLANREADINEGHLARDLPGIAVSCHGSEIGFFE